MTDRPSPAEFRALAGEYRLVPVWRELLADALTPVAAFDRLGAGVGAGLLETADGQLPGRYSIIGLDPLGMLVVHDRVVRWAGRAMCPLPPGATLSDAVRAVAEALPAPPPDPALPAVTGFGVWGADAMRPPGARAVLPSPDAPPDSAVTFPGTVLVFDHLTQRLRLTVHALIDPAGDPAEAYARAQARLTAITDQLAPVAPALPVRVPVPGEPRFDSDLPDPAFRRLIEAAHQRVRAGEVRQVNISRRFAVATEVDPLAVYRVLRATNPSPYRYLLRLPGVTMVGAAPQGLVRVRERTVTSYVIAGTRPRGGDPSADAALASELVSDPKERDEHAMLVELAVSDLSTVAEPGTVQVVDSARLVRYSRVMHLVSAVSGVLAGGRDALDALAAGFPAGTVSGTPRAAALRIIDALEPRRRGLYGGAVGYFDGTGNLETCLGVRALQFTGGMGYCQAAAAVVAGSQADLEVAESRAKASALFVALAAAEALAA